jgi:DNA-binding GntR family transcriptional regulator
MVVRNSDAEPGSGRLGPLEAGAPRALAGSRPDAVAAATDGLRTMIVRGDIAPGSELSQVALARLMGVSTTPLREALRQLEAEGLVDSRRHRRPRVSPFDAHDLEAIYGNRVLLEALGVTLTVPTMTARDLEQLRDGLKVLREALPKRDMERWDLAHTAFHMRLVQGSAPKLREQIATLIARSDRYRRMAILGEAPIGRGVGEAEHEAIVDACEAGEAREASLLLAQHLARSALQAGSHIAPEIDLTGVRTALQMVMAWAGSSAPPRGPS